jgi:EamA domain-containing membrane protein RarD
VHKAAKWAVPVLIGLVYGYWAAANRRDGGPITGWNVLFGFLCALAFAVLYVAVRAVAPRLRREPHTLLWFAFTGVTFGFLYAQGDVTVLRATVMALVVAAGVSAVLFYRYYTHEDAEGHRIE